MKIEKLNYPAVMELTAKGAVPLFSDAMMLEGIYPAGGVYLGDMPGIALLKDYLSPAQPVILIGQFAAELAAEAGKLPNVVGYLPSSNEEWERSGGKMDVALMISPYEFSLDYRLARPKIVDIRSLKTYSEGHIAGADSVPGEAMINQLEELPAKGFFYLYGESTAQAVTMVTIIKRMKLHNYYVLEGGYRALQKALDQHQMAGEEAED